MTLPTTAMRTQENFPVSGRNAETEHGKRQLSGSQSRSGQRGQLKTLPEMAIITAKLHLDQPDAISSWMYWISMQMGVPHFFVGLERFFVLFVRVVVFYFVRILFAFFVVVG